MSHDLSKHIIEYNLDLGRTKPDTVHRDASYCPFCDVANLKNILDRRGHMIWLENAYPVLKEAWQTLIIETDDCDADFATYTPEYALALLEFSLEKWRQVKDMGRFRSVLFYRNHGYMSGGTIRHPHSQIVGLEQYDYHHDISPQHLHGHPIMTAKELEINLSDAPLIGFYEVNLILKDEGALPYFVRSMQATALYFIRSFASFNDSYNIFYYDFPGDASLYVKIVPRFLTNPMFVGYKVPQVANKEHVARFIKDFRTHLSQGKD
ncbi:DUF4931 domain-containing protein [Megasphaera vaginalis (ex Srinivasan et al. 2021)]|uniref:DUF4931 domain-containing protein n=1 Tax=Megasphaera vaginalis (ex Srinivasan et al. 2021) TaxID=1111454 RepID=U7UTF8_9FIRM|nr:DUF4931 domain-containing protein [Megasphaera vaginalis (ex Srinivasan et al. 2021)]ERT61738.1 hypothetical protein HMPREF1250_2249 [Megasphaera vaginalis (ex Srinivasan et al. 2021)]